MKAKQKIVRNDSREKLLGELGAEEQRCAECAAELNLAKERLAAFSFGLSHQLRAPLRAIEGFSKILLDHHERDLPQPLHNYLEIIREEASRAAKLIEDLLAAIEQNEPMPDWLRRERK